MPFALDSSPDISEISDAINYLLANFGANMAADPGTGQITGPTGLIIAYLYKYLAIKYADSADGSVNFSNTPTSRLYYGLRNTNDSTESTNPADYIWYKVAGGFGTTNFLWYITSGGRQIQFYVGAVSPALGYATDGLGSINLDIITSTTGQISFLAYFQPASLQVVRSGSPLTPSFTGVQPRLYASAGGALTTYIAASTDSDPAFGNNTWRIGGSSTTGTGDITYNQISIGLPTDGGGYALWPIPTAMSGTPASLLVPVRYKNAAGVVSQANVAQIQLVFIDQGPTGDLIAYPSVYQWAASIPTISGTSTYTWSTSLFTPTPSSWSTTPPASTPGYNLYRAQVTLSAAGGTTTSTINWTTASIGSIGYAGSAGSSARICFSRVASNPAPTTGTVSTSGNSSFPSSSQSLSTWGFSATWGATDPNTSSTDSLYQSDGIYDPASNVTNWSTPYISSLKVGQLSAITVNTGTLTVDTTGYIKGGQTAYNTGTGFFLGYSGGAYKFSIGNSSSSFSYDGTNVGLTGAANIDSTGNARFRGQGGSGWSGLGTVGLIVNDTYTADFGIITSSNSYGSSIYASHGTTGTGEAGLFLRGSTGAGIATTNNDINLTNGQIKFSSTPVSSTDPNTLDTYAEATWTPTFTNFGTVSSSTAAYTKVGRVVTFTLIVNISAAGSSASITRFTLPFNAANATAFFVYAYNITSFGSGGYYQALADGTNSVQVSYVPNGSSGNFFAGNLINGSQMVFSGSYNASS